MSGIDFGVFRRYNRFSYVCFLSFNSCAMNILIRWLVNAIALMAIAYYVPGIVVNGFYAALITVLVLGLINAVIRPIAIFLTLPVNIVTLGLFTLVVNACMLWIAATIVKGFTVTGFWPAFWGALILSIVSSIVGWLLRPERV